MALPPPSLFSPSSPHCSTKKLSLSSSSAPCSSLRCGSVPSFISIVSAHRARRFQVFTAVQKLSVEDGVEKGDVEVGSSDNELKRKLFVANLPHSFGAPDIRELFGQCGTVQDVEIIKKDGRLKGFAFITMASAEGASCVVEKFQSSEVKDRIIRVEYAKSMKKPSRPLEGGSPKPRGETPWKIYVSNLAWKARSSHLRELFSAAFKPVSCRVVFDAPNGRSAGYGFVIFATKEEAEAAVQALDGKELEGRPLRLRIDDKIVEKIQEGQSGTKVESEDNQSASS